MFKKDLIIYSVGKLITIFTIEIGVNCLYELVLGRDITSIIVLGIVFVLVAVRQVGNFHLCIWQVMLIGALAVLFTGQISFQEAFTAINWDLMVFLLGMFVVGQALEESGYLSRLSYRIFKKAHSVDYLVLLILFTMGLGSALLMNDTIAIIGTPLMLYFAKKHALPPKMLLLTLAFAITIGSVVSPIGNPQNLLVALYADLGNTFVTFLKYLFLPTVLNLFLAYVVIKIFFGKYFNGQVLNHQEEPLEDKKLAKLAKISLGLVILLIMVKVGSFFLPLPVEIKLIYIALIPALPILIFSSQRLELIKKIDWHTLIFFAAMFILMESVWNSGFFQTIIYLLDLNITSLAIIFLVSLVLSQLISNVPLVALYLPMLLYAGAETKELMALVSGSTIAGNFFILGAASNIIIIQNAEKKAGETLTFWEFTKVGLPLGIVNIIVYWLFINII